MDPNQSPTEWAREAYEATHPDYPLWGTCPECGKPLSEDEAGYDCCDMCAEELRQEYMP